MSLPNQRIHSPGRIDIHSHLLPAVDDGCRDVAESIECARMLMSAGYTHCFCTPHIWPNLIENRIDLIASRVIDLQQQYDDAGVRLRVLPGGELTLHPQIAQTPADQLVTYSMNRKYALFDLWADQLPEHFEPSVRWMQSLGLTVILAHPERMRAVQMNPGLVDDFAELGLLLQGNLQCFADPIGSDTRITAEQLLSERRYFALGSDTHNPAGLKLRLQGLKNIESRVSAAELDTLLRVNPGKLLPA